MRNRTLHQGRNVPVQDPDDPDDKSFLPGVPYDGLVHAIIADDPEYERVVEPLD